MGPPVVKALLDANFTVTALTRQSSKHTFPASVTAIPVDFTSLDSLTDALKGQDAVVSVLGTMSVGNQGPLVEAALAAGVKRFIPSEFGVNTRKAKGKPIGKILAAKIDLVDELEVKAKENPGFSWTGLGVGLFFDNVSFCVGPPPSLVKLALYIVWIHG